MKLKEKNKEGKKCDKKTVQYKSYNFVSQYGTNNVVNIKDADLTDALCRRDLKLNNGDNDKLFPYNKQTPDSPATIHS
jgi:hypothetical protein